jgi:glycosyltransferase involved in cell wall biosynthesis
MKDHKIEISAVVIAKNEERKIKDCLASIKWADEIILVDNGSIDKTKDIASSYNAKIVDFKNGGYSELRNEGLRVSRGKWILYIDADERVNETLHKEIVLMIRNSKNKYNVFAIPRSNIILGRVMKHGGWWPDYVKRLFRKDKLKKWTGDLHEEPKFEGEMGYLKSALIHIKENNLSEMMDKTNRWSEIEAELMYKAGHPKMNVIRFTSSMFREFWLRMIRNLGFLDGPEGIIYSLYQVWSRFISYAKLWEMQVGVKRIEKT